MKKEHTIKKWCVMTLLIVLFFLGLLISVFIAAMISSNKKQNKISVVDQQTGAKLSPPPTLAPIRYIRFNQPDMDMSTWKTYTDPKLKFSIKYPNDVLIDPKGNHPGVEISFMFADNPTPESEVGDSNDPLQIYSRGGVGDDAYRTYAKVEGPCSDVKGDCCYYYVHIPTDIHWININNAYGVDLTQKNEIANYYLTDDKKSNQVIHIISRMITYKNMPLSIGRVHTIEQMIRTIRFDRK